jgi:hypothetical protein
VTIGQASSQVLLPGHVFIRAVDSHINGGKDMQVVIGTTVDIYPGTKFLLTDAQYSGDKGGVWSGEDGSISGFQIEYGGGKPLPAGGNICLVIPYSSGSSMQTITDIKLNGKSTNALVVGNIGKQSRTTKDDPVFKLDKAEVNSIYIGQGTWQRENDDYRLLGNIVGGATFDRSRGGKTIDQPLDIKETDIKHDVPSSPSFYAFVICDDLIYFCDILQLIDDGQNWNIGAGSNVNDLDFEAICDKVCGVSDCEDIVDISNSPFHNGLYTHEICWGGLYTGDSTGGNYLGDFLTNITVDGNSIVESPEMNFPYCIHFRWPDGDCNIQNQNLYCGQLPCFNSDFENDFYLWIVNHGYRVESVVVAWYPDFRNGCLTIEGTDIETIEGTFEVEEISIHVYQFTTYDDESDLVTLEAKTSCTPVAYQWNTGETSPSIVADMFSTYIVTVTCDDGCEYVQSYNYYDENNNLNTSQIDEQVQTREDVKTKVAHKSSNLLVYPNPANNLIIIEYDLPLSALSYINILDSRGQLIDKIEWEEDVSNLQKKHDISIFAPGPYFIQLVRENTSIIEKVIIIR